MHSKIQPVFSLIVPTYNEAKNIGDFLGAADRALAAVPHEIIVVDDGSPDGTGGLVEALAMNNPDLRLVRRQGERGLSSAVVCGFSYARGRYWGVMDADFSHDERILPALIKALEDGAELAVGSRRVAGGRIENWPLRRRLLSAASTAVVKLLTGVRMMDPLSGFFAVRKETFESARARIKPRGYKILLELAARSRAQKIKEIPYVFKDRRRWASKMSPQVAFSALCQAVELFIGRFHDIPSA